MENLEMTDRAKAVVERAPSFGSGFKIGGIFSFECYDKDGNLKWTDKAKNIMPDAALNSVLDTAFRQQSVLTWYVGLIDSVDYSAIAAGDTLASHAGWKEGNPYTGNRPAWGPAAATGKSIANSTSVDYTINASLTIKGAFLASVNTGTSGVLGAAALFAGGDQAVDDGDTLKVTYTVSATTS